MIKYENPLHCKRFSHFINKKKKNNSKDSHILSTKNNKCICNIHASNFNEWLTNSVVNFEQLSPELEGMATFMKKNVESSLRKWSILAQSTI